MNDMKSSLHLFLLIGLSLCGACQAQDSDVAEMVTLTLPHSPIGESPSVDVYIEGKGPYAFVLDTGAVRSYITTELAYELGLGIEPERTLEVLTIKDLSLIHI